MTVNRLRRKRWQPSLSTIVFALVSWTACSMAELHAGASSASITPNQPVALNGQMNTRIATETASEVMAIALALESRDGDLVKDQAIVVSCDLAMISNGIIEKSRERIKVRIPGFDANKLIVNATHTHTAPVTEVDVYEIPKEGVMQPAEYIEFLCDRIADAAASAWEARKPASAGWGLGHAIVAQNRRTVYADGRAQMYGPTDKPDFRRIEGYEDHGVEVLFFWDTEQQLVATAVNLPCPAQEVEGDSRIDADVWHPVRETLRAKYGNQLTVLGWTGASGDQSPHLMYSKRAEERMRELRSLTRLEELSGRIVRAWEEAYEGAQKDRHADPVLAHSVQTIELPLRIITDDEYASAKAKVEEFSKDPSKRRSETWHQDVVNRYDRQLAGTATPYKMEMHALRIGDIAIATNDFELYTDFGIQMKARSRALQTFIIQLAGHGTYVPTERAAKGGGYSAIAESNVVGHEGGQVLTEMTIEAINLLFPPE
ncbi:MAG: hypothetical protein SGI88_06150 [Candidatus Hydrogenedentes bacterium]|nr:hypothetical protein [Candidatus Hydrogenedentota bacterium]